MPGPCEVDHDGVGVPDRITERSPLSSLRRQCVLLLLPNRNPALLKLDPRQAPINHMPWWIEVDVVLKDRALRINEHVPALAGSQRQLAFLPRDDQPASVAHKLALKPRLVTTVNHLRHRIGN